MIPHYNPVPLTLNPDFDILYVLRSFPKGSGAGLSGLSAQHVLDAASIPLPTPIASSLGSVVNLLVTGNVPLPVSVFLAGGKLVALNKIRGGQPIDFRPIAVGENLRRLTGKCLFALSKEKSSSFFQPFQFGVACKAGAEKVIHSLRNCVEVNWQMGILDPQSGHVERLQLGFQTGCPRRICYFFPELMPWVIRCYGSHTSLFHPQGRTYIRVTHLVLCSSPWCCTNWCPA